jgi:hypothetical protein
MHRGSEVCGEPQAAGSVDGPDLRTKWVDSGNETAIDQDCHKHEAKHCRDDLT